MDDLMRQKIDLMAENFEVLKKAFPWDYDALKHFGALISMTNNNPVDVYKIKSILDYIKSSQGLFSSFRGNNAFIFALLLHPLDDYKIGFQQTLKVFNDLKTIGFKDGTYLPIAAYTIASRCEESSYRLAYERMNAFYTSMKENHFWLTSQDDYILAALLSTTDYQLHETARGIESCYQTLHQTHGFYKGNELQSLSHILALGEEEVAVKCKRASDLNQYLIERKCKLNHYGLSSLGVLTLVSEHPEQIADEVLTVKDYLYQRPGYGFWSIDHTLRTILSAAIVVDHYTEKMSQSTVSVHLANSVTAIVIAQQTAVLAAVSGAYIATSTASTS